MLRQTDDGRGLPGAGTCDDQSAADVGGYGHELLTVQIIALYWVDFSAYFLRQRRGELSIVAAHELGNGVIQVGELPADLPEVSGCQTNVEEQPGGSLADVLSEIRERFQLSLGVGRFAESILAEKGFDVRYSFISVRDLFLLFRIHGYLLVPDQSGFNNCSGLKFNLYKYTLYRFKSIIASY